MSLTESVADFELLAAGPGGVIAAGRPAGGVADGVLGRRRRRGAAHEEQRRQGQRRATGSHCSGWDDRSSKGQGVRDEQSRRSMQCNAADPKRSRDDAEPIASHGAFIPMPLCERQADGTSQQLGVGGVAFVGVGWE